MNQELKQSGVKCSYPTSLTCLHLTHTQSACTFDFSKPPNTLSRPSAHPYPHLQFNSAHAQQKERRGRERGKKCSCLLVGTKALPPGKFIKAKTTSQSEKVNLMLCIRYIAIITARQQILHVDIVCFYIELETFSCGSSPNCVYVSLPVS